MRLRWFYEYMLQQYNKADWVQLHLLGHSGVTGETLEMQ